MKRCYQCDKAVTWLAPDSRCGDCTRMTSEEVRGDVCEVCDGGPGNDGPCLCGISPACRCVDCSGDHHEHDSHCAYMRETHEAQQPAAAWQAIVEACVITEAVTPDEADPRGTLHRLIDYHVALDRDQQPAAAQENSDG